MTSLATAHCSATAQDTVLPGADLIDELQGRWTLQILLCLNTGVHRFSDLRTAIPQVAANILTRRLRGLESAGLVERHYLPPPAARHVYVLAPGATGLKPMLDALASWLAVNPTTRSEADHAPPEEEKL